MTETVKVPDEFLPLFERAEALVGAYFRRKKEVPQKGHIDIDGERYILVRAASLSVEFYDMMLDLYRGREAEAFKVAKNLLFHIAHFIGHSDAREFHRKLGLQDPVEKLSAGPVHFAHTGWAFVDIFPESRLAPDESFFLVYDHPYSFESDSWRKAGRAAPFPVCFMNAGYSSGWCEESFGVDLVATEILCTGKGDPFCRFVMAHPTQIEKKVGEYLAAHPDIAPMVSSYEVPGEFVRKELEERLRVSEDRYRLLFENAFDAIVILEDGKIEHVNRRTTELFQTTRSALRGRDLSDLAPPSQQDGKSSREIFDERVEKALAGEPQVFPMQFLMKGGSPFDVELSLNRVEGTPGSLFAILRDVTERIRAEAERERLETEVHQLQKMDALGTLAGGIAHDFNNLLTGISGSLHILREEIPEDSPVQAIADDAMSAIDRASALVRHLLTFSRTSQKVTEKVDLNLLVEENLRLLRETVDPRISLVTDFSKENLVVDGDPNHLAQAVMNIALNARDSILEKLETAVHPPEAGAGSLIRFETAGISGRYGEAREGVPVREGEFVRLTVSDNGNGMDEETRERVFEPFFTTKPVGRGTGLGLTMVYGIVQRQGGWIEIESEVGEGTRVQVYFPRAVGGAPEAGDSWREAAPALGGNEKVLFVDDEWLLRKIGARQLENSGYQVFTANDGREGLHVFERERNGMDIVVLDLTMPGLSGREVLEKIKALSPEVPVIVTSGYFTDANANDLLIEGAEAFLPKPYAPDDLLRLVREVLDRAPKGGNP